MNPPRLSRTSLGKVKQRTGGFMCTGRKCERLRKAYLVALNILAVDGGRRRNAPLSIHSFTGAESEGAGTDDQVVPQEHTLYWF